MKIENNNIIKLAGGGGVPPFVGYTPMAGIPANAPTDNVTPTKEDDNEGIGSLLGKDMIKHLYEKGLPTDVAAYVDEIADLEEQIQLTGVKSVRAYKMVLSKLSDVATQKKLFETAIERANKNNSLNEVAIDDYGRAFVYEDGKISHKRISDLSESDRTLTNAELAEIRIKNPKFAFDQNIISTINNSVSIDNIQSKLWNQIKNIGSSEVSNQTFMTKSKKQNIEKGLAALLGDGPDGVYKVGQKSKGQDAQIQQALTYLYGGLSYNEKALLQEYARRQGVNSPEGAFSIIQSMVLSATNTSFENSVDFDSAATTAKVGKSAKGEKDEIEYNPTYSYWAGENGQLGKMVLNPGGQYAIESTAIHYAQLQNSKGEPIRPGSLRDLLNSGIGSMVDIQNGFYIGDQRVDTKLSDQVYYTAEGGSNVLLPFKYDAQGGIAPDFDIIENYSKLQDELERLPAAATPKQVQNLYNKYGLDDYYEYDSNGSVVPKKSKFKKFLATNVMANGDGSFFSDKYVGAINPNNDSKFITNIKETSMNKDTAKNIMSGGLTKDAKNPYKPVGDIFLGVAYLPLVENAGQALNASGQNPTLTDGEMTGIKDIRYVKGSQKRMDAVNSFIPQDTSKLGI